MLEDRFVCGTTSVSFGGHRRLFDCKPGDVGVYATKVIQSPRENFEEAYAFVGNPVNDEYVSDFRSRKKLGKNWGVVIVPKNSLEGVDAQSAKGIIEEREDGYVVAGILLADSVRHDAKRFISDEHEVVFASPEDFPGLNLEL